MQMDRIFLVFLMIEGLRKNKVKIKKWNGKNTGDFLHIGAACIFLPTWKKIACQILPGIFLNFYHGPDFLASVLRVPFVDDIAEGGKLIVALSTVSTIVHSDKMNIVLWEHDFRIYTHL